ncbi:MAG: peptide-methionine (S)-S-oxide reductase MsrA [Verrucomicrobiota bacterium]|nr:peptide-methionine (S)-S-oxide reductase MsrA [Verrucomicrobiota bacterium]
MNIYIYIVAFISTALLGNKCIAQQTTEGLKQYTNIIPTNMSEAVFGAGCFWCLESAYEEIDGVKEAINGYAGGTELAPTYSKVSKGQTTHAEVIKVIYNPEVVTYRELVDFFWSTHDASRSDGVWPDFGPQYRSILLYQNDAEKKAIEASSTEHEARTGQFIATEIKALDIFHPAELYHQDYAEKNPKDRYVRSIIGPKMKKLDLGK